MSEQVREYRDNGAISQARVEFEALLKLPFSATEVISA
jgi:hypothetical protein